MMPSLSPSPVAYKTTTFDTSKALYYAGYDRPRTAFYWVAEPDTDSGMLLQADNEQLENLVLAKGWQIYPAWQFEELRVLVPRAMALVFVGDSCTLWCKGLMPKGTDNIFIESDGCAVEQLGQLLVRARHRGIIGPDECKPALVG